MQSKNIGWESGQQKRASHHLPELKESLQLKWHDMEGRWPSDQAIPDFQATSEVSSECEKECFEWSFQCWMRLKSTILRIVHHLIQLLQMSDQYYMTMCQAP